MRASFVLAHPGAAVGTTFNLEGPVGRTMYIQVSGLASLTGNLSVSLA